MSLVFRIIEYGVGDAWQNMALDEALARCVGEGSSPTTLRLYGWSPAAVSIGFSQKIREVVDLEFCHSRGLDIIRRITGGGAVVHASGGLTYSLIINAADPWIPKDMLESYAAICQPIVNTLKRMGVDAYFKPVNDVEAGGRKLSGSAQSRRFGALLQHGTLLLDLDSSLLGALKVPIGKLRGKGLSTVEERVTTLHNLLDREVCLDSVSALLTEEFGLSLGCIPSPGMPTGRESALSRELAVCYRSEEWLFRS